MNQTLLLWLYAAGISVGYMLIYVLVFCFSRRSLFQKDRLLRTGERMELLADGDSLEYDLRLALAASGFRRMDIIVRIPKNAEMRDDMIDTVRMMRRRHKNIFYTVE